MSTSRANELRPAASADAAVDGAAGWRARWALRLAIAAMVVTLASLGLPPLVSPPDLTQHDVLPELVGAGLSQTNARQVDVFFLGNSLAGHGIDVLEFSRRTGRNARMLWTARSAGGWWYLVFKHVLASAERRPGLVVVCFLDDYLTRTSLPAGLQDVERVLALFGEEDQRAGAADYVAESSHSRTFLFLDRQWPLIGVRGETRRRLEGAVKGYVARLAGRSPAMVDASLERVFELGAKDAELLDQSAPQAVDVRLYDFPRVEEHSFLPDLLAVAGANHLPIVFLHMPRKDAPSRRSDPEAEDARRRYLADLDRYLGERGFTLLDLSEIDGLAFEHFGAGDHLTPAGRALFMPVLEAALEPYLPPAAPAATQ